ncbi:peptidoglycan-associated lipoprotein Pal [Kordiimonas aquimaris]|uniref:peptidoglycan-associated lipoprotein Pal n=1 Tax=Kordiimonas aquimaris TaxID=707591 RepID=UPI0021CF9E3C|nr:peptidoglycan-associated lipoprotein Pal [Kordiimonas aquimaris]
MTSVHLGKKFVFVTAAALLLAACSKDPAPTETVSAPEETATESNRNNGQPSAVEMQRLEEERLEAARRDAFGSANQSSLDAFSGDRVFFGYDSSELTSEARSILAKQYEWLQYHNRARVTIEGHCDERGTREYNLALGERRANAVKSYLMALGLPASRMSTISYGKERPAVVGNGQSSWSQNRRGVMTVN